MKFIIEKHTETDNDPSRIAIDFVGPYSSIEQAEEKVKEELGTIYIFPGSVYYSTRKITRMIVWPLRDGVEYSKNLVRTYDFGGKSCAD